MRRSGQHRSACSPQDLIVVAMEARVVGEAGCGETKKPDAIPICSICSMAREPHGIEAAASAKTQNISESSCPPVFALEHQFLQPLSHRLSHFPLCKFIPQHLEPE